MGYEPQKFSGIVIRVEADGFGIVKFDEPVGANTHGVFSTTISSTLPFSDLRPGVHVVGTAVSYGSNLSAVKSLLVTPSN
jgi:hypothetical protein